jgi:hypothetical protein
MVYIRSEQQLSKKKKKKKSYRHKNSIFKQGSICTKLEFLKISIVVVVLDLLRYFHLLFSSIQLKSNSISEFKSIVFILFTFA